MNIFRPFWQNYFIPQIIMGYLLGAVFFSLPLAAGENDFLDEASGAVIALPKNRPLYTRADPGPWHGLEGLHDPRLTSKIRKEGLENIRRIFVRIPHPPAVNDDDSIKAVYLLDKDGIVVGYRGFEKVDKVFEAEIRINGVINHLQVYVECAHHGLWRWDYRLQGADVKLI